MAKSNILIAFLIIFILPVFIGSYNKYENYEYSEMNYNEIGKEYTEYFSEGMEEISIISGIGEASIYVMDKIGKVITWVKDTLVNIYNFVINIPQRIYNLFKNNNGKEDNYVGPPTAGGDGWESPDFGFSGLL